MLVVFKSCLQIQTWSWHSLPLCTRHCSRKHMLADTFKNGMEWSAAIPDWFMSLSPMWTLTQSMSIKNLLKFGLNLEGSDEKRCELCKWDYPCHLKSLNETGKWLDEHSQLPGARFGATCIQITMQTFSTPRWDMMSTRATYTSFALNG